MQGLFLVELFELYHHYNVHEDSGRGVAELVSAARSAGLGYEMQSNFVDGPVDADSEWRRWGYNEERKRYSPSKDNPGTLILRTLFAIYALTTLLFAVTTLDLVPSSLMLSPSEINLTLPCDEDVYSASSPAAWKTLFITRKRLPSFSQCFQDLLHTSKCTVQTFSGRFSMFGGLALIVALNAEIHRHLFKNTSNCVENPVILQEKFELGLKAWEFAWRSHPHASLSVTNSPFGPLAADLVPLLNLAYVRLFADTSRALAVHHPVGNVFPFLTAENGGMSNAAIRIRVLKAVGYAINSLYLSEWFVGMLGHSSSATASSPQKRNWSFVAPFAGLESAVVVGTWLDRLVELRCPVRDPEAKFLGRMDRVFPNSGVKRPGAEGRRIIDVWGVLCDEDVMRALPSTGHFQQCY